MTDQDKICEALLHRGFRELPKESVERREGRKGARMFERDVWSEGNGQGKIVGVSRRLVKPRGGVYSGQHLDILNTPVKKFLLEYYETYCAK
jgi:hypothetical protein